MESRPPDTATTSGSPRAASAPTASVTSALARDLHGRRDGRGCLGLPLATMSRYISGSHSRAEESCGDARTARSDLGRRRTDRVLHRADLDQLAARAVSDAAVHHPTDLATGQDEEAKGEKRAQALICSVFSGGHPRQGFALCRVSL